MEKGEEYALSFFPPSPNITVSAVDDVPETRSRPMLRSSAGWGELPVYHWNMAQGSFETGYRPGLASALCWWLPSLCGAPDLTHIFPGDTLEFSGVLFDCAHPERATYEWSFDEGIVAASPNSQSTSVSIDSFPSWRSVLALVKAKFSGDTELCSTLGFTIGTNAIPQAGVSVSVPPAMFLNDDDDNSDGTNDYEHVDFSIAENDVVKGSVVFHSDVFTNGTVRIGVSDFPGDVYTNDDASAMVMGTFDILINGEEDHSVDLYFNPASWSLYQVPAVTATWIPESGEQQTVTVPFTVVEPVVQPICSVTKTASPQGESHVYTLNPCGVAVNDDAYFKIGLSPASFPDSDIVWTNYDGHLEFVDGNRGREVHVRGRSVGEAELEVIIGGRTRFAPTFSLRVVTPQSHKITAWIVSDAENNGARRVEDVQNMIAPLNDIYRQVGVSFYLDSVTVTNIPDAFNLLYDSTTNDVWNYGRLVDVGHGTGGIECYFVNDVFRQDGKLGPLAFNCDCGLVLTAGASANTLAHEIGHAFGLKDIYASNREKDVTILPADELQVYGEMIHYASCSDDWNGGCNGHGDGGARYFPSGTMLKNVLLRLVMYGFDQEGSDQRDITIGGVRGIWYTESNGVRHWNLSDAPVGFFSNVFKKASPAHQ